MGANAVAIMKHDTLHPGLALAPTSSEQRLVKALASVVQAGDAYVPTIILLCELFRYHSQLQPPTTLLKVGATFSEFDQKARIQLGACGIRQ